MKLLIKFACKYMQVLVAKYSTHGNLGHQSQFKYRNGA